MAVHSMAVVLLTLSLVRISLAVPAHKAPAGIEAPCETARRQAFAAPSGPRDMTLTDACVRGYDNVATACGHAAAAQHVPGQCTAWCQLVDPQWWRKCQGVREYAALDADASHPLSGFNAKCQAANKPTCSPCPGHASATDVLLQDKGVLTPGSAQAVTLIRSWRGPSSFP